MAIHSDSPPHECYEVDVEENPGKHSLVEAALADQLSPHMTSRSHPCSWVFSTCYHELININVI